MAEFLSLYSKDFLNGAPRNSFTSINRKVSRLAGFYGGSNHVMCIRFEFATAAKSISMSFCNTEDLGSGNVMRYKFTDAEEPSLQNATNAIEGDGIFEVSAGKRAFTQVKVKKNFSAGMHYMYIWTNTAPGVANAMYTLWTPDYYGFSASYEEGTDDVVSIFSAGAWKKYIVRIWHDGMWRTYRIIDRFAKLMDRKTRALHDTVYLTDETIEDETLTTTARIEDETIYL